jgi:hypothetical protein
VKFLLPPLVCAIAAHASIIPVAGGSLEEGGTTINTPAQRTSFSGTNGTDSVFVSFFGLGECCSGDTFYEWSSGTATFNDILSGSFSFYLHKGRGALTIYAEDGSQIIASVQLRGSVKAYKPVWDSDLPIRDYTRKYDIVATPEPRPLALCLSGMAALMAIRLARGACQS